MENEEDQIVEEQESKEQIEKTKRSSTPREKGVLEKKVKKKIALSVAGGACACCLPIVIFLMSLSLFTIVAAYLKGLIT